jgi:multiple sugar transport system substrate-binding protein
VVDDGQAWEELHEASDQALGVARSMGLAAALAHPHAAKAAATTATVWWVQGFAEQEHISFKKLVADYEKASGNTLDYAIIPYAPSRQKIVSAITSGEVPGLFQNNPGEILALYPGMISWST